MEKGCYLKKYNIKHVDWRDIHLLKKFLNVNGRILPMKKTNCSAKEQKMVEMAVKRARYMALLPYTDY